MSAITRITTLFTRIKNKINPADIQPNASLKLTRNQSFAKNNSLDFLNNGTLNDIHEVSSDSIDEINEAFADAVFEENNESSNNLNIFA